MHTHNGGTWNRIGARFAAALVLAALVLAAPFAARAQMPAPPLTATWVREHYRKLEVRIPMRDGIKLFTSLYIPRDTARAAPFIMQRTPYSVAPYGDTAFRTNLGPSGNPKYAEAGYIFVYQDARGRHFSEGVFQEMSPARPRRVPAGETDEATDTYDTVEWLVRNVPHNNGRVGVYGTSYPGFYTTASCLSGHPGVRACAPGAPMTDIGFQDDVNHNGAFLLAHNFSFYTGFGRGPRTVPGFDPRYPFAMGTPDAYDFYLKLGPLGPGTRALLQPAGSAALWDSILTHPNYDAYWAARDIRPAFNDVKPAFLLIGGWFDTEDLFGPLGTWRALGERSPATDARIVEGPWSHGGWARGDGDALGVQRFALKTGPFHRDSVEFPFFEHHLRDAPDPRLPKALMFETGANAWRRYDSWPPAAATPVSLFFLPGGKLGFAPPPAATGAAAYDAYVSDPARPVPLVERIESHGMPRDYITGDQRFAARRPDVLTYVTDVLTEDVRLAGPVSPTLHVATTGTDADFIVKLIDVMPDNAADWPDDKTFKVGGAQLLVRGEPIRGKFRRSMAKPVPFTPNQPDSVSFTMPDIHHTFAKGHRIMVQVQSSWFPHIDRNPQTFVANIFEAKPSDFRVATMRVYRSAAQPSRLQLLRMP